LRSICWAGKGVRGRRANIGENLIHAKKLDPDRVCVAIEPNPTCVDYLYRLARARKWQGVTIIPAALGDGFGLSVLHLFHPIDADASASLRPDWEPGVLEKRTVVCIPFSAVEGVLDRVALVKIDVEGHEAAVLGGVMPRVARDRAAVILETLPTPENAEAHRKMEAVIAQHGYGIRRVLHARRETVPMDRFPRTATVRTGTSFCCRAPEPALSRRRPDDRVTRARRGHRREYGFSGMTGLW